MNSALDALRHEHRTILAAVATGERLVALAQSGTAVPQPSLDALRRFFALYVHGVHYQKEDAVLFPMLRRKGIHEGAGCVGVLAAEHGESSDAFPEQLPGVDEIAALRAYCSLLRNHIRREEDVLFPIVQRSISPDDDRELLAKFEQVDAAASRAGLDEILSAVRAAGQGM